MAKKKLYRTVFRFEVLSEEQIGDNGLSLSEIDDETQNGSWSGQFLDNEVYNEELSGMDAVKKVVAQGSDPEFFSMDMEGNEIDD